MEIPASPVTPSPPPKPIWQHNPNASSCQIDTGVITERSILTQTKYNRDTSSCQIDIGVLSERPIVNQKVENKTVAQCILACMTLFILASTFALGIFTVPIEKSTTQHDLDDVWEVAMGLIHFGSAPVAVVASVFLDRFSYFSKTIRIRILCATSSITLLSLTISSIGISAHNPTIIITSTGMYAFPLAISKFYLFFYNKIFSKSHHFRRKGFIQHLYCNKAEIELTYWLFFRSKDYLLGNELLMAWVPRRKGLAIGFGQFSLGLGTILFTQAFNKLISAVGVCTALVYIGGGLALLSLVPTGLLIWPDEDSSHCGNAMETARKKEVTASISSESFPLLCHPYTEHHGIKSTPKRAVRLSWRQIVKSSDFWHYIVIVLTAGASYAFNPFYYKLGLLFSKPMERLIRLFQITDIIATILSLVASSVTDILHTSQGYWFSGARNLILIFLSAQTILFSWMTWLTRQRNFWGFLIVKSLLKIVMTCHGGCASFLARDFFGAPNSCLVFGLGAGLALGFGEGISVWLMSAVENFAHSRNGPNLVPEDYNPFFVIAGVWTLLGLVCTIMIQKSRLAFPESLQ